MATSRAGAVGALGTSAAFILPSFLLVLGVAVLYVQYQGLGIVHALFHGVAPAVIAIIAVAAVKLARLTDQRDVRLWLISAALLVVTAVTGAEITFLVIAAGLVMVAWDAPPRFLKRLLGQASVAMLPLTPSHFRLALGAVSGSGLLALSLFFLKAGALTFGSGLATVPVLRDGVVAQNHWLTGQQFLDAVAMGLITPGRVVITCNFHSLSRGRIRWCRCCHAGDIHPDLPWRRLSWPVAYPLPGQPAGPDILSRERRPQPPAPLAAPPLS